MAEKKQARRKPARWRTVPIKVFGRTDGYRYELWRGDTRLAVVAETYRSTRFHKDYYWRTLVAPSQRADGIRKLEEAKAQARAAAHKSEEP